MKSIITLLALSFVTPCLFSAETDYSRVHAVFQKHCIDCHNANDAEGQLILDTHELLMKGGESGASVVPGRSAESLLIKSVEGTWEKDGKRKIMPPGSKREKLKAEEIALLKAWIDAGAHGPTGAVKRVELVTPKIRVKAEARRPVNSLAFAPKSKLLAIARYGEVELRSFTAEGRAAVSSPGRDTNSNHTTVDVAKRRAEDSDALPPLAGFRGSVNAVLFSADGSQLFAAAGEPGMFGEVRQWNVTEGKLVRVLEGHSDAIYSVALSPDGQVLATGSYDQKIKLWDTERGQELNTLSGHNGAVFGLAFRPDGKILASASADRTVKLWNVQSGKRTDTLSQPLKEQYTVVFSADGKRLFGAGTDSRIRVWQISDAATETTNPLLESRFAHEGTILRLVFAPDGRTVLSCADDRTVKLWSADDVKQLRVLDKQPDWVSAATFVDAQRVAVGRMDGTLEIYDISGAALRAEAK